MTDNSTSRAAANMMGALAPFEAALIAMKGVRVCSMERNEGPLRFILKISAYADGGVELRGQWWGQLPDYILEKAGHILDDEERGLGLLTKEIKFERVPKIVQHYLLSDDPVRWTIVMAHMRNLAEQGWMQSQGAYEQAILNLETHTVLEDSEDTERKIFDEELANEDAARVSD